MSGWKKCPEIDKNGERCDQKAKPGLNFMQCINKNCRNYSKELRAEYFEEMASPLTMDKLNKTVKYLIDKGPYEQDWTVAKPYGAAKWGKDLWELSDAYSKLDVEEDTKPLGSD
jgi:hypothetical protein